MKTKTNVGVDLQLPEMTYEELQMAYYTVLDNLSTLSDNSVSYDHYVEMKENYLRALNAILYTIDPLAENRIEFLRSWYVDEKLRIGKPDNIN